MDNIERLTSYFRNFPGIGPRQAKRFVYHILSRRQNEIDAFINSIKEVRDSVYSCHFCGRFFENHNKITPTGKILCPICLDSNRDNSILLVTAKDSDLEAIEKSRSFQGKYYVFGGNIPILDKDESYKNRVKDLINKITENSKEIKEIILSFSLNPEGEHTIEIIRNELKDIVEEKKIKVSLLGRGLSSGTEIEYSDKETLTYALKNRF